MGDFNRKAKYIVFIGLIAIFTLVISFWAYRYKICNTLEIFYCGNNSSSYMEQSAQLFWDDGDGFSEKKSLTEKIFKRSAVFHIYDLKNAKSIRIDFSNSNEQFGVDKIRIRSGAFTLLELDGAALLTHGYFEDVNSVTQKNNALILQSDSGDARYFFNDEVKDIIIDKLNNTLYNRAFFVVVAVLCFSILLIWIYYCIYKKFDKKYVFMSTVLIIVLFLIIFMAGMSDTYGHPDEDETRASIDYYLTNWKLPNLADEKLENIFSNYGCTRLNELSVYYILTGKMGIICKQLLHINPYYRMFNVLLFAILVIIALYWGRKNIFIFLPLLISPQVWYVFSYATSDAWDFFLSYIIIGEILVDDSMLNRALEKKKVLVLFLYGALCAMLLMGKANYMVVLLLTFVLFLFKWIDKRFDLKLFLNYMSICLAFGIIYGGRILIDYFVYDGHKNEIYKAVRLLHRSIEIEQMVSYRDQGLSVLDMCTNYNFLRTNFFSFVGHYGWMNKPSSNEYYLLMALCYVLIAIECGYLIIHENKLMTKLLLVSVTFVGLLSFAVSMYHSWTVDYQPQGRYLFPILFVVLVIIFILKEKVAKTLLLKSISVASILGLYSFVVYGMGQTIII